MSLMEAATSDCAKRPNPLVFRAGLRLIVEGGRPSIDLSYGSNTEEVLAGQEAKGT